jgi:hypothetical protein
MINKVGCKDDDGRVVEFSVKGDVDRELDKLIRVKVKDWDKVMV